MAGAYKPVGIDDDELFPPRVEVRLAATFAAKVAALTSIGGLTPANDRLPYYTGASTAALATFTAAGRALIDDADASAQLTTLGLSTFVKTLMDDADASAFMTTLGISTFVKTILDDANAAGVRSTISAQQSNTNLDAISGLTSAADKLAYFTGSGTASVTDISSLARTLLGNTTAAFMLGTLGFTPYSAGLIAESSASGARTNLGAATTIVRTSITSSGTPTPALAGERNFYAITALAANATFGAPTGVPADGDTLVIRIKDNATPRTLAYNSIYRAIGVTLPTTTIASKTHYLGMTYNFADTKWDVTAVTVQA